MKDVYVITGATGGMGADIAKNLNKKGILLLVDLNEEKLIELKKALKTKKIDADYATCDISNQAQIEALVKKTESLGKFKALIHTAGISGSMATADVIFKVNLIGTQLLMDAFFRIADHSVIMNFASMAGHMVPNFFLYNKTLLNPLQPNFLKKMKRFTKGNPGYAYAFSKKGVIMITENEVGKWAKKDSRILSISPGTFETPMADLEEDNNKEMKVMLDHTPVPRRGKPEEITDLVKLLLDVEYINGVDILIDGGITTFMKKNDILKGK